MSITKTITQQLAPSGRTFCLCICLFFTLPHTVMAQFVFSAPPRENKADGMETYGPLVEYLSTILGEKVVYQHPGGWARYASDMRKGRYDIVFDAPHFGAWRIKHIDHSTIVSLPGMLKFVVVARVGNQDINKLNDLLYTKICGLASPNLGTMTIYNLFENPVNLPSIHDVKGGFKGIYKAFLNNECAAAILRDSFYHKLTPRQKLELKVIVTTKPIPNQTITISSRLRGRKLLITEKLTSPEGRHAIQKLLYRFGHEDDRLLSTSNHKFKDLDKLLTGVVWGW